MAKQVLYRRGTTAEHALFTGANGEVTVDTVKHVVIVHDGVTAGGIPQANAALVNSQITVLTANAANQATAITVLQANAGVQANAIVALQSNAAAQQANITAFTLASNSTTIFANIAGVRANVEAANVQIGLLFGNATIQNEAIMLANASITALRANIAAANVAIAGIVTGTAFVTQTAFSNNLTAVNSAISTQGTTFATNVAVAGIRANVTAANSAISSLQANIAAANVAIENIALSPSLINSIAQSVGPIVTAGSFYSNSNLAGYLSGNVTVGKNGNVWTFDNTGTTTFPTGGLISGYPGGLGGSWFVTPGNGAGGVSSQDGQQYIQINNDLFVEIGTGYGTANSFVWQFGLDGTFALDGNISTTGNVNASRFNFANGVNILSTVPNFFSNLTGVGTGLIAGSQIDVKLANTVISNKVVNSLGGGGEPPSLTSQGIVDVSAGKVVVAQQIINDAGDNTVLTSSNQIEVNAGNVLIGQRVINTVGNSTIEAFSGWTFGSVGGGNLILPTNGNINFANGVNILSGVQTNITVLQSNVSFTMANYQQWSSNVSTIGAALNQLAARLKAAGF